MTDTFERGGTMRTTRNAVLAVAVAGLLAGTAACGSDDGNGGGSANGDGNGGQGAIGGASEALQAAAAATQDATSAEFEGVTRMPDEAGGEMTMTGAMSWADELVMDMTMAGGELAADPTAPDEVEVRWLDNVMFMNMGDEFAADFDGRTWMKMDLLALAEETGDPAAADALSFGLEDANQDPAQQMALLLQSPDIEHVGEDTVDGVPVQHYQGTISIEDALESGGGAEGLSEEERQELADTMREMGTEAYDLDVWVDENDLPVQIHQSYDSDMGPVETEMNYRNYGTDVSVEAPEESSVVDVLELLRMFEGEMEEMEMAPGEQPEM